VTSVDHLREIFHHVAGVLVWPVLAGLLGLIAAMLVTLGAFAREAWERRRGRHASLDADRAALDTAGRTAAAPALDLRLEEILQAAERRRWRSLGRLRLVVRVGPSLGLMGTLIPMADALQGLADGNLPALASNMVTAFAATVLGLSVSVVAYLVAAAREAWVRADTEALAFHAERTLRAAAPLPALGSQPSALRSSPTP